MLNTRVLTVKFLVSTAVLALTGLAACVPPPEKAPRTDQLPDWKLDLQSPPRIPVRDLWGRSSDRGGGHRPPIPRTDDRTSSTGTIPQTPLLAKFDNVDGVSLETKNQCVVEICGQTKNISVPSDILNFPVERLDTSAGTIFDEELAPLLSQQLKDGIEEENLSIKRIEEARDRLSAVKFSASEHALISLLWAIKRVPMTRTAVKPDPSDPEKFTVDESLLGAAMPELDPSALASFAGILRDMLASKTFRMATSIGTMPFAEFLKHHYRGKPAAEARTLLAAEIKQSFQSIKRKFPALSIPEVLSIDALGRGDDLRPSEVEGLKSALFVRYLDTAVDSLVEKKLSGETQIKELMAGFFEKSFQKVKETVQKPERRAYHLELCRSHFIRYYTAQPTEDQIKKFGSVIARSKSAVLKALGELGFDADTMTVLEETVKRAEFSLPLARSAAVQKQIELARKAAENGARSLEFQKNASDTTLALLIAFYEVDPKREEQLSKSYCEHYFPESHSDAAYTMYGRIVSSWQSVRFPRTGITVVAHELGHLVSAALAKRKTGAAYPKYQALRQCTARQHGADQGPDRREEDFADLIAGRALHHLRAGGLDLPNVFCDIMGKDDARWGTSTGLSLTYPADHQGSHSTAFYRLLQFQSNSEASVPSTCKEILSSAMPSAAVRCQAK